MDSSSVEKRNLMEEKDFSSRKMMFLQESEIKRSDFSLSLSPASILLMLRTPVRRFCRCVTSSVMAFVNSCLSSLVRFSFSWTSVHERIAASGFLNSWETSLEKLSMNLILALSFSSRAENERESTSISSWRFFPVKELERSLPRESALFHSRPPDVLGEG